MPVSRSTRSILAVALAVSTAMAAAPAQATIELVSASSIQGAVVLFNSGVTTGTTVFSAGPAGSGITVNGGKATLIASGGQATVSGDLDTITRDPNDTVFINNLNFRLTSGGTFNNLEFNLFGGDATLANFWLTDDAGDVFSFPFLHLGSGSNFFGFRGIDGQTIRNVAFTTTGGTGIQDIRQIRLDQMPLVTAVPEPATWAMMIVGFGLVGFATRARKRANATVLA